MLQFGAGNHVCLGENIALTEIYKLVPSLLRTDEVIFLQAILFDIEID